MHVVCSAPEPYAANLRSLTLLQPEIAAEIDAAVVPPGARQTLGRDGSRTYLLAGGEGRPVWLGGSSMPGVSAAELFGRYQHDRGGNVVLPGIFTGREALVIADRLPPHIAVFVVESDPLHYKLALHLHDYRALLEGARLIFLLESDLEDRLVRFFSVHSGFEMPTQLLNVPHRSAAQIAELQSRLERAGQRVLAGQAGLLDACARAIAARPRRQFDDLSGSCPRVAVLSTNLSRQTADFAAMLGRALEDLGWPHGVCVPDSPASCHNVARMKAVDQLGADLALFVNSLPGALRDLLPEALPVVCWFLPGAPVPDARPISIGPHDRFLAASAKQLADLSAAGIPARQTHHIEPGADGLFLRPLFARAETGATGITLLCELPDDRPEAVDIKLPSQLALWRAMQAAAARHADEWRDEIARIVLDEAQQASGVVITEPALRDQFAVFLRTRIAPVAVAVATVRSLSERTLSIAAYGANRPDALPAGVVRGGPIPSAEALREILAGSEWLILPVHHPANVQLCLHALAAGTRVAMRAGPVPFEHEHPSLEAIARHIRFYRSSRELLRHLDGPIGEQTRDDARRIIRDEHSVACRLRSIVGLVNGGMEPNGATSAESDVSSAGRPVGVSGA